MNEYRIASVAVLLERIDALTLDDLCRNDVALWWIKQLRRSLACERDGLCAVTFNRRGEIVRGWAH